MVDLASLPLRLGVGVAISRLDLAPGLGGLGLDPVLSLHDFFYSGHSADWAPIGPGGYAMEVEFVAYLSKTPRLCAGAHDDSTPVPKALDARVKPAIECATALALS